MPLRLLIDEDSKSRELVGALRAVGHDVVTTADEGIDGFSDVDVLACAKAKGRIVLTQNAGDFRALHGSGNDHAGIVVIYPLRNPLRPLPVPDIIRALANLEAARVPRRGAV